MTKFYSSEEKRTPKVVEITDVKFQDVLNKPHWYNHKIIRVKGYYHFSFENSSLSPQKNSNEAIWVELLTSDTITFTSNNSIVKKTLDNSNISLQNNNELDGKYVEVVGMFDDKDLGHMEGYIGTIKKLSDFIILTKQ